MNGVSQPIPKEIEMKIILVLVCLIVAPLTAFCDPQFADCKDALVQGKSFALNAEGLRRKILSRAIRSGRSVNIDNSPDFSREDHYWAVAAIYLVRNKCDSEFDELQSFKNGMAASFDGNLEAALAEIGCSGPVTLLNPSGCY
jgi:hypothetical protein